MSQIKTGAMLSYLSMAVGFLSSMAVTPVITRFLGQSNYGLYNLVSSVVAYFSVFNFGFTSAYMRFYIQYKTKGDEQGINRLNALYVWVFGFIGLFVMLLAFAAAFYPSVIFGGKLTDDDLKIAQITVIILTFNLAVSLPASISTSYIICNEHFVFHKTIQIIKQIMLPVANIAALLFCNGIIALAISVVFTTLLIELLNYRYAITKLKMVFDFKSFDFSLLKQMAAFSSFIFINMVVDQLNWNADKMILGHIRGTISVAIYGVSAQVNTYYIQVASTLAYLFVPRVHTLVSEGKIEDLNRLFVKLGRVQFIILGLIAQILIFFGEPFIVLWVGHEYIESYIISLVLVMPVTIPLVQTLSIEIQRAMNKHKFRSIVYLIVAIINIVISIPLTRLWGPLGAATGTGICVIIGHGFIMAYYNQKFLKIDVVRLWYENIKITPAFVFPIMYGILVKQLIDASKPLLLIAGIFLMVVIYLISMWFLGMNHDEKNELRAIYSKVFRLQSPS